MAAALGHMVASMSRGKKAYLQYESQLSAAIAQLAQLREELKAASDADAESYNAVVKAYKAAKESNDGDAAITHALKGAAGVPLGVAERGREVAGILESLRPITNPKMASDLTVGLGALENVEINLESLSEPGFVSATRERVAALKR
jgi:formiminotetrahydrofolate cyclodeaminase